MQVNQVNHDSNCYFMCLNITMCEDFSFKYFIELFDMLHSFPFQTHLSNYRHKGRKISITNFTWYLLKMHWNFQLLDLIWKFCFPPPHCSRITGCSKQFFLQLFSKGFLDFHDFPRGVQKQHWPNHIKISFFLSILNIKFN